MRGLSPPRPPFSIVFCPRRRLIRAAGILAFRAHELSIPQLPTDAPDTLPRVNIGESVET